MSTQTLFMPECRQFDRVKSIILNFPPKGTAGFVLQSVKLPKRSPRPPARTSANVLLVRRLMKRAAGALIFMLITQHGLSEVSVRVYPSIVHN